MGQAAPVFKQCTGLKRLIARELGAMRARSEKPWGAHR
jgi:hypothetical protein